MSLFGGNASSAGAGNLGGSSLFGSQPNPGAQPATGQPGGLFGSTAAPTSSLFGARPAAANTAQPQAAGGLFGSTVGQQQRPSLFGTTSASQPAGGGSLFGANASTAQPSLFGAAAPGTQAQSSANPPAGGSLFGPTNSINTGGLNQSQSQNQSSVAYFDTLLAKSKKQADGETAFEDLPSLQLGLGDLRQKLKKLGPRTQDRLYDGNGHTLLAASGVDPGSAVRDLGSFGAQIGKTDRSAQGFGGAGEVDLDTYLSNLQTKTTLSMIADGLERSVRDFDTFLEDNVTMEWEAQRRRIYEHFGIKPREERAGGSTPGRETQGGFGRSRRQARQQTPRSTQKTSAFGRSSLHKSVIGTPSRIGSHIAEFSDVEGGVEKSGTASLDERFLREKQEKLAEKVRALNDSQLNRHRYDILHELADVEQKSGDRHASHIVEAYHAITEIVGEKLEDQSTLPNRRQFAKIYLDPDTNSQAAVSMRNAILNGANSFLEKQFLEQVHDLVAKYPQDANLGGLPSIVSRIKGYIRLRVARKTLVPDNTELQYLPNGDLPWAIVFYLLRAGQVADAATYVNDNQVAFRSIDRTFPSYINSYASSEDRRLKRQMQDRCNNEYNQRVRNAPENSIDPFRMLCYKVIGRCDISNRSLDGIQSDVNDWIWLQFNLAREGDRSVEMAGETYGLADLQTTIREIGLKNFPKAGSEDPTGSFGMFFYLQVLSGMFEQAIAYLYSFSYVDAVHFAIALEYYGLLRAADPFTVTNELLSYNTRNLPQISFGRMVGFYTRDFRAANVGAAVEYLVLICLNADNLDDSADLQQARLCHEALRELVLETREFSKLVGDIKPDGQRIRGLIEQRGPLIALQAEADFIKTITYTAARYAESNGRTTDAVLLYHLAGDYDKVIVIVSKALSEAISVDIGEDPMRLMPVKPRVDGKEAEAQPGSSLSLAAIDDPVELARTMMTMYERDQMFRLRIEDPNRIACNVLLQMSEIKSLVEAEKWAQCLDKIKALEILPMEARGDPSIIRTYASKFSSLTDPVSTNVPNLLMWTIICCTKLREREQQRQFGANTGTSLQLLDKLKQITVDLTTYTSQLRYRFPPYLHEALARASAD